MIFPNYNPTRKATRQSPLRTPLYRVVVEVRGEPEPLAVSPGMLKQYAEMFAAEVRKQNQANRETTWGNPTVVLCHL